jgi:PKD repeat protein
MKTKQILLLLVLAIMVFACKKAEYTNTSTSTSPVFYFNGSINGAPVNIQVGVGNYTMATSYTKDAKNIYNYTGEFMTIGSSGTGPNSLIVFFKDNSQSPSSNPKHIDTVITPGYFSFSNPAGMPSAYNVQFQDFFNQTAVSYSWSFGDGLTGTGNTPVHLYSRPGIYNITMSVNSSSCISYDTNDAAIGQVGNAFQTGFSYGAFTGNTTTFNPVSGGVGPYTYLWNFGDGTTSSSASPTHTFPSTGVYYVSVLTTDATSYTDKQAINVATPSATGCAVGFYAGTQTPVANPFNLNDVGINWYDNAGTLWTSENNKQRLKSMFKVLSVANYKANAAGQATKIISATISCKLYDAANDSILFSGNVVLGVAHF